MSELSVLGLTHASTMPAMNEVKAAYKKLALVRHPYIYTFFFGCGLALALGGQLLSPRDINTNKAFVYFVFPSRHRGSHVTLASDCHLKTSKPFWRDLAWDTGYSFIYIHIYMYTCISNMYIYIYMC